MYATVQTNIKKKKYNKKSFEQLIKNNIKQT